MVSEFTQRQWRWFLAGCGLAVGGSAGLMAFPWLAVAAAGSDLAVVALVCGFVALMGLGAMLAIFNLKHS